MLIALMRKYVFKKKTFCIRGEDINELCINVEQLPNEHFYSLLHTSKVLK